MQAYSNFETQLTGSSEDVQAIKAVMEKALKVDLSREDCSFFVYENYKVVYPWDFTDMAKDMAKAAREAEFRMEGDTDCTQSCGQQMDFVIAYQGGKLTCASSTWYSTWDTRLFDNRYDIYCMEYRANFADLGDDEEVAYPLSQAEFEALKTDFSMTYQLDDLSIVKEVPLVDFREIPLD